MSAADAAGRRAFLRSACRHCAGYGALGLGAAAWAQAPADWKAPPRFLRPSLESDEGGTLASALEILARHAARVLESLTAVRLAQLGAQPATASPSTALQ